MIRGQLQENWKIHKYLEATSVGQRRNQKRNFRSLEKLQVMASEKSYGF